MFNVLLDDNFPSEYKGYKLNTDFRVGILITLLQEDDSFEDDIKILKAFDLLYADEVPPQEIAFDGLIWFLSCGKSEIFLQGEVKPKSSSDKAIDFRIDHLDIWGAFFNRGISLEKSRMHWFKFMTIIANLGDCQLTQKIQYRLTDLSDLKGDTRTTYAKLKEQFKVRKLITKEERELELKQAEEHYGSYYANMLRLNGG